MCGGGIGQGKENSFGLAMMQVAGVAAEQQNPGFRSGIFPQNGPNNSLGVPYTYGAGFSDTYTPSEFLNNSAAGIAEKNRRKSLTPDQYGRGIWGKKPSQAKGQVAKQPTQVAKNPGGLGGSTRRELIKGGSDEWSTGQKTLMGA